MGGDRDRIEVLDFLYRSIEISLVEERHEETWTKRKNFSVSKSKRIWGVDYRRKEYYIVIILVSKCILGFCIDNSSSRETKTTKYIPA